MADSKIDREKIERYFSGKYSDADEAYVNEIFLDNNKEVELKYLLSRKYYDILSEDDLNKKDLNHILYKLNYYINTKTAERESGKFEKFKTRALRIAGIIILPIALFWGIKGYLNYSKAKETWVEIKALPWTRAQFSLPDGTTGWINSNSSVKYNGTFISDRIVNLTGEAYFDVIRDKKRPFRVNTNEIIVKVLGTKFNIASYENEKNVEVVLEDGKLELKARGMSNPQILNPNDLVVYDKVTKNISAEVVQPQKYIAWTEGKLVFRNDPLDVIARRLERWYNVDVEIIGNLDDDLRLRATFIDESLEEVLYFLKRSLPIDYQIENGNLKPDKTYIKKKVIISNRTE